MVRSLAVWGGRLTVTWHDRTCPHYLADRVLVSRES